MSRNQLGISIGDRQQYERHKERTDDGKAGNHGKNKGHVVLRYRAGPVREGTGRDPAMVAGVQISPGMEMKTAG